ncbi:MAG: replication-relaxation family protein [Acidobacteria bacterium]|nr:replication-relaxation family protein [Acidobacteriota bacterium]MBV9477391.1 replication-relaxation family protein [Acidobacteriota bacterium]
MLLALARCRILSFDQIRRLVFQQLSPQRVGQRVRALAEQGWLRTWEDVSRVGGRPRYAVPSRRALAVARQMLAADAAASTATHIASVVLRHADRRPLVLAPRVTPGFLSHQREVNDLLIAYGSIQDVRLHWATSFDRPLPLHARGLALPQPDYVLVLDDALIFGEHDRGHESLAHFRRAKAERYAALAAQPDLVREFFGFDRFVVWVTVLDARAGAPLRRLSSLVEVARDAAASDVMAFTLAGWAVSTPAAPIWFCDGAMPEEHYIGEAKASPALRSMPAHPPARGVWHQLHIRHAHAVRDLIADVRGGRGARGSLTTSRPAPSHPGPLPPFARTLSRGRSGPRHDVASLARFHAEHRSIVQCFRDAPVSAARGCARAWSRRGGRALPEITSRGVSCPKWLHSRVGRISPRKEISSTRTRWSVPIARCAQATSARTSMGGSSIRRFARSACGGLRPMRAVRSRRCAMLNIERYRGTRFWGLYEAGQLLCVTVYKKGAEAVKTRIERGTPAPAPSPPVIAPEPPRRTRRPA